MTGTIQFDTIPQLPENWWDGTDADEVWPTWGEFKSYFWGANIRNQFLSRGVDLSGDGLAGSKGPSRGRAHPQYVGVDTMSDSANSLANNDKVYNQMKTYLAKGHTLIIPIDLRHSLPAMEKAKFSLGTGIAKDQPGATNIHAHIWGALIGLIESTDNVIYNTDMWTPDLTKPQYHRDGTRVDLPDLAAIKTYHKNLVAAAKS